MKRLLIIATGLLVLSTFTSCNEKEEERKWEDNIKLSTGTVDFDINKGSVEVTTGNAGWWFYCVGTEGDVYYPEYAGNKPYEERVTIVADWLTVENTDEKTIRVSVETNLMGRDRTAVIIVQSGNYYDQIDVTQTKEGELKPSSKRLLPSTLEVEYSGIETNSTVHTYKIEYDNQNRFNKIIESNYIKELSQNNPIATRTFEYKDKVIVVTETLSLPSDENFKPVPEVTTYTIGASEVLVNGKNPIRINDKGYLLEYSYKYDPNGNLVSIKVHEPLKLTYDTNNGIYRYVNMPSWFLTLPYNVPKAMHSLFNNCLTELTDNEHAAGEGYTIEYNADDYPVNIKSRAIQMIGGANSVWKIGYVDASEVDK